MPITYRSGSSGAGAASVTIARPAGAVAGDVLVAHIVVVGAAGVPATPAGWTHQVGAATGGGVNQLDVYTRVAGGSEPASYTFTPTGAPTNVEGVIDAYVGVDNTTPTDVAPTSQTGGTNIIAWVAQVTATDLAWFVCAGIEAGFDVVPATPGVWIDRTSGPGALTGSATQEVPTAGTSLSPRNTGGTDWCVTTLVLRLRPAPKITQQPDDAGRQAGTTGSYSVSATASPGGGALSYQWQRAEPDSESFVNIGGATSSTFTTGTLGIDADDGARYCVVVTDANGSTTSRLAQLSVGVAGAVIKLNVGGAPLGLELPFAAAASARTWAMHIGGAPVVLDQSFFSVPAQSKWSWLLGLAYLPTPSVHTVALGQATETDLAQALTRLKTRLLGQALETDIAQPIARVKVKVLGQALEVDLAQPVARAGAGQTVVLNQAEEIDLAQPVTALLIQPEVQPAVTYGHGRRKRDGVAYQDRSEHLPTARYVPSRPGEQQLVDVVRQHWELLELRQANARKRKRITVQGKGGPAAADVSAGGPTKPTPGVQKAPGRRAAMSPVLQIDLDAILTRKTLDHAESEAARYTKLMAAVAEVEETELLMLMAMVAAEDDD